MAYEIPGFSFTLPAGADFSGGEQFRFCDVSDAGKAVNPSADGNVIGVRYTRSKADEATTIVHSGVAIVEAAAAVDLGQAVTTDANGCAVPATIGGGACGRALEAAVASGVQIAVLLTPSTAAPSA